MKWLDPSKVPRGRWMRLLWGIVYFVGTTIGVWWLLQWNLETNILAADTTAGQRSTAYFLVLAFAGVYIFWVAVEAQRNGLSRDQDGPDTRPRIVPDQQRSIPSPSPMPFTKRVWRYVKWSVSVLLLLTWLLVWNFEQHVLPVDADQRTRVLGYAVPVFCLVMVVLICMILQWRWVPTPTTAEGATGSQTWLYRLLWIVLPWLLCSFVIYEVLRINLRFFILPAQVNPSHRAFGYYLPVAFALLIYVPEFIRFLWRESQLLPSKDDASSAM